MHSFDAFWTAQQDHLVPDGGDDLENIVTSCFVCNNLKSDFVPEGSSREARIDSSRQHIMKQRSRKIEEDFKSWWQD